MGEEKTIICGVCGLAKASDEVVAGLAVRSAIAALIIKDHPDWTPEKTICRDDLNRYRAQYVQGVLESEKGDLSVIEAEVIDLRTLVPLDTETLARSAGKTGRCAVVVQSPLTASFAEHVAFEVQGRAFGALKKPVEIVSSYSVPPPMAACLENENIPSAERIYRAAVGLVKG